MNSAGTLSYMLADHLGSTSTVVDGGGTPVSSQRYYPFGATRSGGVGTDKRFTGHQQEGDLYFMQSRFYDPEIGRFLQPDTIVPSPMDPQSLNRYSYVLNNPLRYTDPTGRCGFNAVDPSLNNLLGLCGRGTINSLTGEVTHTFESTSSEVTLQGPLFDVYKGSGEGTIRYVEICYEPWVFGPCSEVRTINLDFEITLSIGEPAFDPNSDPRLRLGEVVAAITLQVDRPGGPFGASNQLSGEVWWDADYDPIPLLPAEVGCAFVCPTTYHATLRGGGILNEPVIRSIQLFLSLQGGNATERSITVNIPRIILYPSTQ